MIIFILKYTILKYNYIILNIHYGIRKLWRSLVEIFPSNSANLKIYLSK